ncbi:MAG: hypothetical protein QOH05_3231 [Acetobacteraceae bacterium]|jgi:hypothetical protein|nr:hypothetical protein [Acetobacteraceae bacterium]
MRTRIVTWLLLAAVFLLGIANLALLPPFEAFDEANYWSAIQQLADTGRIPRYDDARLSADVTSYPGPEPSSMGQPYRDFFAGSNNVAAVTETGPSHYTPGPELNYESQHPPLYFELMRPVYRAFATLRWPAHFLALRMVNWTIAFIGFGLGVLSTQGVLRRRNYPETILFVPAIWPLLFPQFFDEFTRVTNDTVCFVLISAGWCLAITFIERGASWWRSAGIGVLLGAGLLTKAFFLPVSVGVTLLVLVAAWRTRTLDGAGKALAVPLLAALIGGFWYARALLQTGNVTGAGDFVQLRQYGGLIGATLRTFPSATDLLVRLPVGYGAGLFRMMVGFCWAGTWSFMHPSRVVVLPVVALALIPCALYAWRVRRQDLLALAPVFIVAPVVAGLLYHLAVMLVATGEGSGTPGWFFHLFAGPLSLVLALGWGRRWLMLPLTSYAVLHGAVMAWAQAAFFSGCLPRAGRGEVDLLDAVCVVNVKQLRFLAFPDLAFSTLALGVGALGIAAVVLMIAHRSESSLAH